MSKFSKRFSKKGKPKPKKTVTPRQQMVRKQILIGVILVIVIGLLLTAVWYGARIQSLQLKGVEVMGGFTIPHATIANVAEEELVGTYLKLVPKKFAPLYPKDTITERIVEVPRVKNVHLEVDARKKLIIAFEEYKPEALWCGEESGECWFIDSLGFAFAKAPELSGGAFVRYYNDETPEHTASFAQVDFLKMVGEFIEQLEDELSLYAVEVHVLGDQDIEYQVAGGGRIKVSQTMSPKTSFNNLKTILQSEEFAHLEPGTFHYVDLRFGDKVFVSEVEPEEEVASSTEAELEE